MEPKEKVADNAELFTNYEISKYSVINDRSLPPILRTEANYWKMKFFETRFELVKVNRGMTRLVKQKKRWGNVAMLCREAFDNGKKEGKK